MTADLRSHAPTIEMIGPEPPEVAAGADIRPEGQGVVRGGMRA